jgi:hypothetical protein
VKITADSRSGPFYVRKYDKFGEKATDQHSTVTSLKAAYSWASKRLGIVVSEAELDTVENPRKRSMTLPTAAPDRIFAEDENT